MMVTTVSAFVTAALLAVSAMRRRGTSFVTDVSLYAIAAVTMGLSAASLPLWARAGYILLGVVIAGLATRDILARRTHASPHAG